MDVGIKKMKIAFLNISHGKIYRGAETFVTELASKLGKDNQVKIYSGNLKPPKRIPFIWRFYLDPNGLVILFFTLKCLPEILKEKYDVVVPVDGGWQPFLVRVATWIYGGKMAVSGQSGIGWDERVNLLSFPDIFIPLSSAALKWSRRFAPWIKSVYIPNGVDTQKFSINGNRYKTNLSKPIILVVGALTKEKRISLAIQAVSKMNKASLLVVGDGELKKEITDCGIKLLGSRFELKSVCFEDMPDVYRCADVFTIPSSSSHSFEIVLTEAMSCNIPVVANLDPIRSEIVGKAGILIDPTKIQEYSSSLEKALNTSWGDLPRHQAQKFDWSNIALRYQHEFELLLGIKEKSR